MSVLKYLPDVTHITEESYDDNHTRENGESCISKKDRIKLQDKIKFYESVGISRSE
jgi:hypothetical protein